MTKFEYDAGPVPIFNVLGVFKEPGTTQTITVLPIPRQNFYTIYREHKNKEILSIANITEESAIKLLSDNRFAKTAYGQELLVCNSLKAAPEQWDISTRFI